MKKISLLLLFLALAAPLPAGAADGIAVIPPRNPAPTVKTAAEELSTHLAMLGREQESLRIRLEPDDAMDREAWRITRRGNDVVISGGLPRGILYGVYEFLERFAGIFWLDPWTTSVPENGRVVIPEGTQLEGAPGFRWRGIYITLAADPAKLKFFVRNRENIFFDFKLAEDFSRSYGIQKVLGSPNPFNTLFYYMKSWDLQKDADAFSMDKDGRRVKARDVFGPGQVCFTSPKAREKFIGQLEQYILADRRKYGADAPVVYNISINDTKDKCLCPACVKRAGVYGSDSGVMLEFVNAVARSVEKKYPEILIQTSCYLSYESPPLRGIVPGPNVAVRCSLSPWGSSRLNLRLPLSHPVNAQSAAFLKKWSSLGRIQIWNYWVNFGRNIDKNAGAVNTRVIAENVKTYHKLGADWVFSECEFPDTASFHPLRVWLGYRLKNDPGLDPEKLMTLFFTRFYGRAARPMRKLYDFLSTRQAPFLETGSADYKDAEFFSTADALLDEAEKAASGDARLIERITRERTVLDIAFFSLGAGTASPARAARLPGNWEHLIRRWYHDTWQYKKAMTDMRETLGKFLDRPVPGARFPLPEALKGCEVYEITAEKFSALGDRELLRLGLKELRDPDAAGGRAMAVKFEKSPFRKDGTFTIGVHSRAKRRPVFSRKIPAAAIPSDGKYHLYYAGEFTLLPGSLLYIHDSWHMQQDLAGYWNAQGGNSYRLYISLRMTGPGFVPGAAGETLLACDRILLVPVGIKKNQHKDFR